MDERVTRCETPEACEQFAINVKNRLPELALAARRRAVELRAQRHDATSPAEKEAIRAVYAYEQGLRIKHGGKNIRANRTWKMINQRGIIHAVEKVVSRDGDATGYTTLVEMGMSDFAFEAVVCRHPKEFSTEAVQRSQARLDQQKGREKAKQE